MRVGVISTYPPIECGVATYTQYLTEALRASSVDVYVVGHLGSSGPRVFPVFDYEDEDLPERAFSAMMRLTPDVVHVQHEFGMYGRHHGVNAVPLLLRFRLLGVPLVVTLHTVYARIDPPHRILLENILTNADAAIVHEPYQRDALHREFGGRFDGKIRVIPHGARLVDPDPDARRRLGLPEDRPIVLMIGYFRPSKRFERIVDLFPRVVERVPDALLVVAGKIRGQEFLEYRDMLFERIRSSPVRDQIVLIRGQLAQETFDRILSAADVVALPYEINAQSGVLAHCLAFGRPVVTSDTESMRRALADSGAGLVCANDDEFVEAISRLLGDPALRERCGEAARRHVRERIAWPLVAARHLDLYRRLVGYEAIEPNVLVVD
ncbi:MAG: glycosyltransferase [Deltaproteobacteria bacterium]|nr:glycosyltransferase [Deltaproteobacteria bacterium]